jgi:hypothetical protein
VQKPRDVRFPLSPPITERQWELYRLSVVEAWQESPQKAAVIGAIKHKLMILALQEKASVEVHFHLHGTGATTYSAVNAGTLTFPSKRPIRALIFFAVG